MSTSLGSSVRLTQYAAGGGFDVPAKSTTYSINRGLWGTTIGGRETLTTDQPLPANTIIQLEIMRENKKVFEGSIGIDQIKRKFTELVGFLYKECSFPYGSFLMTGTGIVPGNDFTLQKDDQIKITIEPIGTLVNTVG